MQTFKPSPHFKNSSLYPETSDMLWFPFAALSMGPLLQVETIVEITNRVCERYLKHSIRTPAGSRSCAGSLKS